MSFQTFVNGTEMVSFSSFVRSIVTAMVVICFSILAFLLLLNGTKEQQSWGFQIVATVMGALFGLAGVGAYSNKVVRESSEKYAPVMEAKAKAHIAGAAAAAVIKEKVLDAKAARENGGPAPAKEPAVQVNQTVNTEE